MEKLKWYLWQLVPATYHSFYTEDGEQYFHVWQMWFGRCFNETRVKVLTKESLDLELEKMMAGMARRMVQSQKINVNRAFFGEGE